MSQYSETMGSFIRTGNYPLEANYIFESEQALKSFYSESLNNTLLHKGLLKIVALEDKLILYWVIEKDGNLVFEPLIFSDSLDNLQELLQLLRKDFEDTSSDIYDRITRIIGTDNYSDFQEGLDDLLKISNLLLQVKAYAELTKKELQALVGTEEDIIPALDSLRYHNFIEVAELLKTFFEEPVYEDFNTLKKILDVIYKIIATCENLHSNLLTELNQTLQGVGLDSSGLYSPDSETNYLKNATSVMNALRILDNKIKEALVGITIIPSNRDIVPLEITKTSNGYYIGANLLLSATQGNDLVKNSDGLYFNISTEYNKGILTIKANNKIVGQHNIGLSSIVDRGYYDSDTESIVIIFKLDNGEKETVSIPAGTLIREWEIDNTHPTKVVELTREEVYGGGADRLSADVRISTNRTNILEKDNNTLLVRGVSDNIIYEGDITVKGKLDSLTTDSDNLGTLFTNLSLLLVAEILRSTDEDLAHSNSISDLQYQIDLKAPINSPTFTGIPQIEVSPDSTDASLRIPTTNWVQGRIKERVGELEDDINDSLRIIEEKLNLLKPLVWIEVE